MSRRVLPGVGQGRQCRNRCGLGFRRSIHHDLGCLIQCRLLVSDRVCALVFEYLWRSGIHDHILQAIC